MSSCKNSAFVWLLRVYHVNKEADSREWWRVLNRHQKDRSRSIVNPTIAILESICVRSGSFLSENTWGSVENRAWCLNRRGRRRRRSRVTRVIPLKPEGASPRHAETVRLVVGQVGGRSTVNLAFVDKRGLHTSCLLLVVKWSKDLHTYYPPMSAHTESYGGEVGGTPDGI